MWPKWLIQRRCSDCIERAPELYLLVLRFKWRGSPALKRILSRESKLVIEGYPRCANSFALAAFRSVNGGSGQLKIATHVHSPVQVKQAIKWNIPSMVLIREPDCAVPSLLAYAVQLQKVSQSELRGNGGELLVRYWTERYVDFYDQLLKHANSIFFAEFSDVTLDFGNVTKRFNEKFGTDFECFNHSDENVESIFKYSKMHLSPSAERDRLKAEFERIYFSEHNRQLREQANEIYQSVVVDRVT